MTQMTTYYLVFTGEDSPRDRPRGLYRRVLEDGKVVASEAYHPRTGRVLNDYWARVPYKGEPEKHRIEIDERQARQTQAAFDALHRQRTD